MQSNSPRHQRLLYMLYELNGINGCYSTTAAGFEDTVRSGDCNVLTWMKGLLLRANYWNEATCAWIYIFLSADSFENNNQNTCYDNVDYQTGPQWLFLCWLLWNSLSTLWLVAAHKNCSNTMRALRWCLTKISILFRYVWIYLCNSIECNIYILLNILFEYCKMFSVRWGMVWWRHMSVTKLLPNMLRLNTGNIFSMF